MARRYIPKGAYDEFVAAVNDSTLSGWAKERAIGRLNQLAVVGPNPSSMLGHHDLDRLTEQFAIGRGLPARQAAVEAAMFLAEREGVPFYPTAQQERDMSDAQRERFARSDVYRQRNETPIADTLTEALDYAVERQRERDKYVDEFIRPTVQQQIAALRENAAAIPDSGDPADIERIDKLAAIPSEDEWVSRLARQRFDYDPTADFATLSKPQTDEYLRDSADLRSEPVFLTDLAEVEDA